MHTCHVKLLFYKAICTRLQTSNINSILAGNNPDDLLHLHSKLKTSLQWIGRRQLQDETRNLEVLELGANYIRGLKVVFHAPCFRPSLVSTNIDQKLYSKNLFQQYSRKGSPEWWMKKPWGLYAGTLHPNCISVLASIVSPEAKYTPKC